MKFPNSSIYLIFFSGKYKIPMQPRTQPQLTMMERIYIEKGEDWINEAYEAALEASITQYPISKKCWKEEIYPILRRDRLRGQGTFLSVHRSWKSFKRQVKSTKCRIHTGAVQNGYPVVSCRLVATPSAKLQLHQVPSYRASNWQFDPYDSSASTNHACNNKLCLVHARLSTKEQNIAEKYCRSWMIVGQNLVQICAHEPQCLHLGVYYNIK